MNHADPRVDAQIVRPLGWALLAFFALAGAAVGDINIKHTPPILILGIEMRPIRAWQICYAVGCIGYLLLLWSFRRRATAGFDARAHRSVRTRTIILAALLLRIPLLSSPPNTDCNRYIWEGRLQNLGISPYKHAPEDEALAHLHDNVYEGVNKKHHPTIYPPLSQLKFRLIAAIHYGVKSPQIAHTILDMAVVLALASLLRTLGRPNWYLAIYALCPLVLAAFAHGGHNDSLLILLILGFLAAGAARRWGWAGFALGLAILAKTTPAILLALLIRRSWKAVAVALTTVALGYLLFIDAGADLFNVLLRFGSQDGPFNNLFDELRIWLRKSGGPAFYLSHRNAAAIGILLALTAYRIWRPGGRAAQRDLMCGTGYQPVNEQVPCGTGVSLVNEDQRKDRPGILCQPAIDPNHRVQHGSALQPKGHKNRKPGPQDSPHVLVSDARWLLVSVVLLLPIIHYWYLTWPLAIIALYPRGCWSWLVLVVTMTLYWYADWAGQVGLPWKLPLWVTAVIWAPFFAAWIAENTSMRHENRAQSP